METENGFKSSLIEKLTKHPSHFNFFQAVRLFDMRYITDLSSFESRGASIGDNTLPHREIIRLKNKMSLAFPATDVCDFIPSVIDETTAQRTQPLLITSLFGLANFSGPLPPYFTDLILEQKRLGNTTLSELLNIFDHRLISFYYRAWAKQRIFMNYEKQQSSTNHINQHARIIKSFHGNALFLDKNQTLINNVSVFYAGLLSQQPRSASGLVRLLASYLSLPITLHQCNEEWLLLSKRDCTMLGAKTSYNQLGKTALLGSKVKSVRDTFTLVIGSLDYPTFQRFLPPSSFLDNLHELIKYYINNNLKYTINIILRKTEVPTCKLNSSFRLGWNSWLITKPPLADKRDTTITATTRIRQPQY